MKSYFSLQIQSMILLLLAFSTCLADPCRSYHFLNGTSRSIRAPFSGPPLSDTTLQNRWYRFDGGRESQTIHTTCIENYGMCGTISPGWMNGKHPTVAENIVNRRVCFYVLGNCCSHTLSIQVKNCGKYKIYRLPSTSILPFNARYCTTQQDRCDPNPCFNNGTCNRQEEDYSCNCPTNFTGKNCEKDFDPCSRLPCLNGTCLKNNDSYQCLCPRGYTGRNCEQNFDSCSRQPCINGICLMNNDSYQCLCFRGYTGRNCERDIDECKNGTNACHEICINTFGSYKCSCRLGNILLNDYVSCHDPCLNYTQITDKTRSIYYMDKSQILSDQAMINNTWYRFNGGNNSQMMANRPVSMLQCAAISPGWLATNHPQTSQGITIGRVCFTWVERNCRWARTIRIRNCNQYFVYQLPPPLAQYQRYCTTKQDFCDPNPCFNGTCLSQSDGFYCSCNSGFTGKLCQHDVNQCLSNPCKYGRCIDLDSGYRCICQQGFTGYDCQHDINECQNETNLCKEVCVNTLGSYKCACKLGNILLNDNISCFDPCSKYTQIDDESRAVNWNVKNLTSNEQSLMNNTWYRFNGGKISQMMITYPIPMLKCGALSPGWLTGNHSEVSQGIISGKVCFVWLNNNCQWARTIRIRNCHQFFVYQLPPPPVYNQRYCTAKYDFCDPNPCIYGACLSQNDGYYCRCNAGFTGKLCNQDANECLSNPCIHGKCKNLRAGYQCNCSQGFTGINCENDINECQQMNGGCAHDCINTVGSYYCQCRYGYVGRNDSSRCLDPCTAYQTIADSTRLIKNRHLIPLRCDGDDITPNWYRLTGSNGSNFMLSANCPPIARCQTVSTGWMNGSHPKVQDGIVNRTICFNHNSQCCYKTSDIMVKNCNQYQVYYLSPPKDYPLCSRYCANRWHPCDPNLCQNGKCTARNSTAFQCQCSPGFTGRLCDTEINECSSNPCLTGDCIDNINHYTCQCSPGMTGTNCDTDVNECLNKNGGCSHHCKNLYSSYYCRCPDNLELHTDNHTCLDPCSVNHISFNNTFNQSSDFMKVFKINSQCNSYSRNYKPARWYEANLQDNCTNLANWIDINQQQVNRDLNLKSRLICINFGLSTCFKTLSMKTKSCANGKVIYKADPSSACILNYCSQVSDPDYCRSSPCRQGQCLSTASGYQCKCFRGFVGLNCQYKDSCSSFPCLYGNCEITYNGNYQCRCYPYYTGNRCQTKMNATEYCLTKATSCYDIAMQQPNKKLPNQYYDIYDNRTCYFMNVKKWRVYCDFNSQPGYAWTLIDSFSFANRQHPKIRRSFPYDSPINHENVSSKPWPLYRMSREQMLSTYHQYQNFSDGGLWRATCNFNSLSFPLLTDPVDYIQSSFLRWNILEVGTADRCQYIDYVNIRGHLYRNTTHFIDTGTSEHFHIESSFGCSDRAVPDSVYSEDNFGQYESYNRLFTCSANATSISSWWIGTKIQ